MYIYICVYIYIYVWIYIYMYMNIHTNMYLHTYVHTFVRINISSAWCAHVPPIAPVCMRCVTHTHERIISNSTHNIISDLFVRLWHDCVWRRDMAHSNVTWLINFLQIDKSICYELMSKNDKSCHTLISHDDMTYQCVTWLVRARVRHGTRLVHVWPDTSMCDVWLINV